MKDLPTIPWDDKPVDWQTKTGGYAKDMTLRDYFAAKAMQSMNSRGDYLDAPASAIALDAYALADAMLKEGA